MAYFAVKQYVMLDRIDHFKKLTILTWKLSEISLDPYRTAFALNYLTVSLSNGLTKSQIQRLLILCCFAIQTVDYGENQTEYEIRVWNENR